MIYRTDTMEALRPLTQDERRAAWASAFYLRGLHHEPEQTRAPEQNNEDTQ